MAYETADGFKSTNRAPMMAHKRSMERKSSPDPLQQPAGGDQEQSDDPNQVAQEHGPAVEVNVMHNHEAGQHHVHSKHTDGHEHHSEHASADEAHDHAKQLAGGGGEQQSDGEDQPEYE